MDLTTGLSVCLSACGQMMSQSKCRNCAIFSHETLQEKAEFEDGYQNVKMSTGLAARSVSLVCVYGDYEATASSQW